MGLEDNFLRGMRRLASGVSIVTTTTADGARCGMTATSVSSLSLYPPSLVVVVNRASWLGRVITDAPGFAVNILGTEHCLIAEAFAGRISGIRGSARFRYGNWRASPEGVPILYDAPACFICKVGDIIQRPTHLLLIGTVAGVHVADRDRDPLVYYSRRLVGICLDGALDPAALPAPPNAG
jgi:flavin reductase (DIM6/NTAB) family NADH-FMN oxidoreductase RutF